MKRLLVFASLFLSNSLIAQVSFEIPDTVCVGEYFSIENTSTTGDEFFWSFVGMIYCNYLNLRPLKLIF